MIARQHGLTSMDNRVNDIYSRRLRAGSRTYFFDVKVNSRNDKYLVVTESRKTGPDIFQHDRVMVFEENMPNFLFCLYEALTEIGVDVTYPPKAQPVEGNREDGNQPPQYRPFPANNQGDNETIPRNVSHHSGQAPYQQRERRPHHSGGGHSGNKRHYYDNNRDSGHSGYKRHHDSNRDGGRDGGVRGPYNRRHQGKDQQHGTGRDYHQRGRHHHHNQRSEPMGGSNQRNNDKNQRFYSTGGFDEF